jgi:hypothetical protein
MEIAMAKYRKTFDLSINDIDLIEEALRRHLSTSTKKTLSSIDESANRKLMEVQSLLGKIHQQKIFYSQVNAPHSPGG